MSFELNEAGFAEFLATQGDEAASRAADAVAAKAKVLAPKRTGEMADSIHAEKQSPGNYRISWDKDHFYGLFAEVGTENQAPHPFLRPALRSIGGRVATDNEE